MKPKRNNREKDQVIEAEERIANYPDYSGNYGKYVTITFPPSFDKDLVLLGFRLQENTECAVRVDAEKKVLEFQWTGPTDEESTVNMGLNSFLEQLREYTPELEFNDSSVIPNGRAVDSFF